MKRIKYKVTLPHPIINFNVKKHVVVRDGPLENLWGGPAKYKKKNSRKGKLNEKKFLHAN